MKGYVRDTLLLVGFTVGVFLLAFVLTAVGDEVVVTDSTTENLTVTDHKIVEDGDGYLLMVELTYESSGPLPGLTGPTDAETTRSRWVAAGHYETRQAAAQELERIEGMTRAETVSSLADAETEGVETDA